MTELKQLEFAFMKNTISSVAPLGYIGGQDEHLGGYCEPLVILYEDGMKQFVLHAMAQSEKGEYVSRRVYDAGVWKPNGRIINNHQKVVFNSESALLEAWEYVRVHLGINNKWNWRKTTSVCDCDATEEEFYKIRSKVKVEGR